MFPLDHSPAADRGPLRAGFGTGVKVNSFQIGCRTFLTVFQDYQAAILDVIPASKLSWKQPATGTKSYLKGIGAKVYPVRRSND